MPKPKTSPDQTPKPYRLLKTDLAAKLSARSKGGITYVLLADTGDDPELHLAVTANEGGGLWSKEAVRLDAIESVLDAYVGLPFPTKALRGAMVGRSANNPPFCLAVLKDLGLVAPAPDNAHQHVKVGDWQAFRTEWLAQPGEPVIYPEPKPDVAEADATSAEMSSVPEDIAPAAAISAKSKKRRKSVEMGGSNDVDEPDADGSTPISNPAVIEPEHAPPAHA